MCGRTTARTVRGFFNLCEGRAIHDAIRKRVLAVAWIDGIRVWPLIAAMAIASIGLNSASTEVAIGAMLICPLMGSVLAIAYVVATLDAGLQRCSAVGLTAQVGAFDTGGTS